MTNINLPKGVKNTSFVSILLAVLQPIFFKVIGFLTRPVVVISRGHLKGVDPGVVNLQNSGIEGKFVTETDQIEFIHQQWAKLKTKLGAIKHVILIPDLSLLSTISLIKKIRNKISEYRGLDLAIEIHTDSANGTNSRKLVFIYGSETGRKRCLQLASYCESKAKELGLECTTDVWPMSATAVKRPAFITQINDTSIILEMGCINSTDVELADLSTIVYHVLSDYNTQNED